MILDEAQHIKNPDSQNAKAACALRARSRFILTGTPIENSLRDLWSLFEFLLPGYLGSSRQDFKDRYETPLLNITAAPGAPASQPASAPSSVWERLQRRIRPQLLRRLKKDILTELPDKIEQVLEIELNEKQKTAYTQLQQTARTQIDQLKDQEEPPACASSPPFFASARPAATSASSAPPTAPPRHKLDALLELLGEAIDGGHRVLVFSQFASMLDLIAAVSRRKQHLPLPARMARPGSGRKLVDRFQNDPSIPVFLISLEPSGVGLNLTAADTVIHFDPVVEPRRRSPGHRPRPPHRPENVVTSIKLIARDTVEERVLRMQEKSAPSSPGLSIRKPNWAASPLTISGSWWGRTR